MGRSYLRKIRHSLHNIPSRCHKCSETNVVLHYRHIAIQCEFEDKDSVCCECTEFPTFLVQSIVDTQNTETFKYCLKCLHNGQTIKKCMGKARYSTTADENELIPMVTTYAFLGNSDCNLCAKSTLRNYFSSTREIKSLQ